ncbi:hypothetical protein DSM106972_081670 [Dulcicalothrix desertica PCC 7102]|uniref:Peptidase M10 serralysin C-terminal domain-containing protein n=1 Tax=Dulcicalothrix desertica PCC 7102 TaxID=232991 RepID=A0A433UXI9_9CYAN|nr:calcium-binding protein [Dulcicalothrix desertica]RUS98538.1 hypothetical protein DSM106972_081670 [Dulcicalothrix desertica PCC 7102]TWH54942.1 putative secreted protein (type I secretion substrate) [Dulcicalothrix desertica PCC 7102]
MPDLTAKEVTNLYLYGTTTTSKNLVNDSLIRPLTLPKVTSVNVDKKDFMAGAGRFAVGATFELVQKFFNPGSSTPLVPAGSYTKQEVANKLKVSNLNWDMRQTDYQDSFDDYAQRVYVYNSQSFQISDNAKFIVEANGAKRIENFAVEFQKGRQENFDFIGGGAIAGAGNPYLEARVDPSRIGRTVNINFVGSLPTTTYNKQSFDNDRVKMSTWKGLNSIKLLLDMGALSDQLFNNGSTKFLEGNKPILYGTVGADTISAASFFNKLNEKYTAYPFNYLSTKATLIEYKNNGVVIIGGDGADKLTGSSKDDKFDGGKGNDILDGGGSNGDIAVYSGNYNDYKLTLSKTDLKTVTIAHIGGTKRDGTDTLTNIEFAQFKDKKVSLKELNTAPVTAIRSIELTQSNNEILGTSGYDELTGSSKGERIIGLQGADKLTGKGGNDQFVYTSIRDKGDTITDFEVGKDTIVFTQLLDSLVRGGYTGTNAFTDGYVRVVEGSISNNFKVEIDADGFTGRDIFQPFITVNVASGGALNNPNNFVF